MVAAENAVLIYKNTAARKVVRRVLCYNNNDPSPSDDEAVTAEAGAGEGDARDKTEEEDDDDMITETTLKEGASRSSFIFSPSLFRSSLLFPNSKDNVSITIRQCGQCGGRQHVFNQHLNLQRGGTGTAEYPGRPFESRVEK